MSPNHLVLQLFVTSVLSLFAYYFGVDQGRKGAREKLVDYDARETAETALAAMARLREELSALRGDTHKDRDEMRGKIMEHDREFVQLRLFCKDAADRCMAEATKITMNQPAQRRS